MPLKAYELSALAVKRLMRPGLFAVGGVTGLALQVQSTGARSWILRITTNGGRREIGLGGYPDVSLSLARDLARQMREEIARGTDPVSERRNRRREAQRAASRVTFEEASVRWHQVRSQEYRNPKHAAQVLTTLKTYAFPFIGRKPVADVGIEDILSVVKPIWTTKTETADRLRGRIENVLSWATAAKLRDGENPARWRGNLDALLPKPSKIAASTHHAALPFVEVPAFLNRLADVDGIGARALEFLILTAARSGEVRLAVWSEFDLPSRLWTIPKERMKAGREHRVPLSQPALAVLSELPRFEGSNSVFVGPRGGPISDMTISAVTRRMAVAAVPHGFRSAFRDWAAERTSYSAEVAEMALAHTIANKVEAAYRRGDLFDKRRALMDDWASFLADAK
jgi:integrase